MKALKERILRDGKCFDGGILKVDNFINHQMDPILMKSMAVEFVRRFAGQEINKILTIEASGIAPAIMVGYLLELPVVFAKKSESKNLDGDVYTALVESYTKGKEYTIRVSKKFLDKDDRVLIIDDFLAKGKAFFGLNEIVRQAGATLCGFGVCIEKGFQEGGRIIRSMGVHLESLAIVELDAYGNIVFNH